MKLNAVQLFQFTRRNLLFLLPLLALMLPSGVSMVMLPSWACVPGSVVAKLDSSDATALIDACRAIRKRGECTLTLSLE